MVIQHIFELLETRPDYDKMRVIGILGMPGSGKTTISKAIREAGREREIAAVPWEMDVYSTSTRANRSRVMAEVRELRAKNQEDPSWPGRAYTYNTPLLAKHLQYFRDGVSFTTAGLCHPLRKSLNVSATVDFQEAARAAITFDGEQTTYDGQTLWCVTEGVIGTCDIRKELDALLFVHAEFDVRAERVRKRLRTLPTPLELDIGFFRDVDEYQRRELGLTPEGADLVIDNNDFDNQRVYPSD